MQTFSKRLKLERHPRGKEAPNRSPQMLTMLAAIVGLVICVVKVEALGDLIGSGEVASA